MENIALKTFLEARDTKELLALMDKVRFGKSYNPFSSNDPDFVMHSADIKEILTARKNAPVHKAVKPHNKKKKMALKKKETVADKLQKKNKKFVDDVVKGMK